MDDTEHLMRSAANRTRLLEAIDQANAGNFVTPSSGCIFCDVGLPTIKMKRQHIHRVDRGGWRTVVCPIKGIKPMSDGSKRV